MVDSNLELCCQTFYHSNRNGTNTGACSSPQLPLTLGLLASDPLCPLHCPGNLRPALLWPLAFLAGQADSDATYSTHLSCPPVLPTCPPHLSCPPVLPTCHAHLPYPPVLPLIPAILWCHQEESLVRKRSDRGPHIADTPRPIEPAGQEGCGFREGMGCTVLSWPGQGQDKVLAEDSS